MQLENGSLNAVTCNATPFCVAVDGGGNVLHSNGSSVTSAWTTVSNVDPLGHVFNKVSCSASACAAGDTSGHVVGTNTPSTNDPTQWKLATVDPGHQLPSAACEPGSSTCLLGDDSGNLLTSTNPGGGAWTTTAVDGMTSLQAVACPSASLCVAGDNAGGMLTSTTPSGAPASWQRAIVDPNPIMAVSCASVALCVAVDQNGNAVTSTNPTGGAGAWSAPANIDPNIQLLAISCPSLSLCVAVDSNGNVITSTTPTGGVGAWSGPVNLENNGNSLNAVSCRPGAVCAVVDSAGNAFTSANPTGGAGAWSGPANIDGNNAFDGVSCSPGLLCLAIDDVANVLVGTPAAPGNTAPPTIAGTPAVGQHLSESPASWTGDPTSFSYLWEDCNNTGAGCSAIPGATGQRYTVVGSDVGHTIRVQETATNAGGTSAPATSTQIVAVPLGASPPADASAPPISGAPIVGRTLHGSPGRWTASTPISFGYQWQACRRSCTNIAGATGSSYTLRRADQGARIRLEVTANNSAGRASATSAQTVAVVSVNQIRSLLLKSLTAHRAGIAKVLQHGYTVSINALVPGKLIVSWTFRHTVVATGSVTYTKAGGRKVHVQLTHAGRRLLAQAGTITLTAQGSFVPAGGGPITASKGFRLS